MEDQEEENLQFTSPGKDGREVYEDSDPENEIDELPTRKRTRTHERKEWVALLSASSWDSCIQKITARIERRDKKDDRDEEEGAAPKVGWNLGWWFNMGRTAQQWGFAKKKDGTSAFSLKHPFFKNRGVYLDDPLVSKSNPYWKKEIFMLVGELLKCIDANYHGVHGDWCLYVSCMMSDMCEVGRHTDKHDVSHQYNIFLGRFENAVYEVESPYNDEVKCFFDTHKVFKSDASTKAAAEGDVVRAHLWKNVAWNDVGLGVRMLHEIRELVPLEEMDRCRKKHAVRGEEAGNALSQMQAAPCFAASGRWFRGISER
ncbi:hypothetical protein CYMTET_51044 [Cymbomonas tetramitiformis]|uniref:Uncharacterized protein n=1 Tax=Cymbomonas tetramitiformis TaxID=36881 RepID=A0AAE0EU56_9CHLO|nr:hypothetical protein CYMTET_51044 [Cymbomonas tetramitiformis]